MTALDKLIEAVEAGTAGAVDFCAAFPSSMKYEDSISALDAALAYKGSLDAALALHEALLPGWTVRLCAFTPHGNSAPHVHVFKMRQTEDDPIMSGNSSGYSGDTPARAWLLAILRAYRSTQGEAG